MKKFNSIALHSENDAQLLLNAHKALIGAGFIDDMNWNKGFIPTKENERNNKNNLKGAGRKVWFYTLSITQDGNLDFHNHECKSNKHIDLTAENLAESIQFVIDNHVFKQAI